MTRSRLSFTWFGKKVSWIFLAKVIVSLIVIAYAAAISTSSRSYQAETGAYFNSVNGLLAIDRGFYLATSNSIANGTCASPAVFGPSPVVANNGITSGDLVFVVRINTTSITLNSNFNVTFYLEDSSFGPLCIQSNSAPTGEIVECEFDIGSPTLPASPYTMRVTVQ